MRVKIAIAGAGLAGLAAGTWLRRAGHEVVIFEAADRTGGRAQTVRRPGTDDVVDVGTQYFHSNYRRALALIKEAGLAPHLSKIRGRTRFFDERARGGSFATGHRMPYIASGSPLANLGMLLKGLGRLLRHPIDPFAVLENAAIDNVAAGDAVSDPFEWEFNARALIAAGALIEPGRSSVSYLHLVRLMRIIVMTDYLTLSGGIGSLHARLAEGLDIRAGSPVARLLGDDSAVGGVGLADGTTVPADRTLVATPPAAAAELLPDTWQDERMFLSSIEQPPAIVVTLFLDRPLERGIWSYVFRPDRKRLASFCVDASMKNPAMTPSGKAALQAWVCHPASDALLAKSDTDVVTDVVKELSASFDGLQSSIEHTHVHRVARAIPRMGLGHNTRAKQFLTNVDARQHIQFCGDYLSGGYMECALWSAERAVAKLVGR